MFVQGHLIGGLDVATELFETGELQQHITEKAPLSFTPDAISKDSEMVQLNVTISRCSLTFSKIRLNDGKILQGLFSPDTKLSEVYKYVMDNRDNHFYGSGSSEIVSPLSKKQFMLAKPHPYEPLDRRSLENTLKDLNLVPRSSLIVIIPQDETTDAQKKDCTTVCVNSTITVSGQSSNIARYSAIFGISLVSLMVIRRFLNKSSLI
jgi:hypothetical protein